MKKMIGIALMSFFLTGCSMISLGLYGKEFQDKMDTFESNANQFSMEISNELKISQYNPTSNQTKVDTTTQNASVEYQKSPYYVHYSENNKNWIQTEYDGIKRTFEYNPYNQYQDKFFYLEIDNPADMMGGLEIDTKHLTIQKKGNHTYILKGVLENFFLDSELEQFYDALYIWMPTKKTENQIQTRLTVIFGEDTVQYALSFEFTHNNITIEYDYHNDISTQPFELLDVNDETAFYPLPSLTKPVLVDASKPIIYKGHQNPFGKYKVYLEPGNYAIYVNDEQSSQLSKFSILPTDNSYQNLATFPMYTNIPMPLNRLFTITQAGYYDLLVEYESSLNPYVVEIKSLDTTLLDLTQPDLIIHQSGEYTYEFTDIFDILTLRFDLPVGTTISIHGSSTLRLIYQDNGNPYYISSILSWEDISLIQSNSVQWVYMSTDATLGTPLSFTITVTIP